MIGDTKPKRGRTHRRLNGNRFGFRRCEANCPRKDVKLNVRVSILLSESSLQSDRSGEHSDVSYDPLESEATVFWDPLVVSASVAMNIAKDTAEKSRFVQDVCKAVFCVLVSDIEDQPMNKSTACHWDRPLYSMTAQISGHSRSLASTPQCSSPICCLSNCARTQRSTRV